MRNKVVLLAVIVAFFLPGVVFASTVSDTEDVDGVRYRHELRDEGDRVRAFASMTALTTQSNPFIEAQIKMRVDVDGIVRTYHGPVEGDSGGFWVHDYTRYFTATHYVRIVWTEFWHLRKGHDFPNTERPLGSIIIRLGITQ